MEAVAIDAEWVETFKTISKEEINSPTKININDIPDIATVYNNMKNKKIYLEKRKQFQKQRETRIKRMKPLFASQPRLEMICKDLRNDFVDSGFTSYAFRDVNAGTFKNKEDDLKYLINLCGYNLTKLELYYYPSSQIMPLIKSNCLNLTSLSLRFKQVENKDFDNVFSNISHLEELIIEWRCKNSTLPMTLIKSLEQVSGTLKLCTILCQPEKYYLSERPVAPSVSSVLSPETEALMTVITH